MRSLTVLLASLVAFTLAPAQPAAAAPVTLKAFITGYSYFDNTPPGSAEISHPVVHRRAGGTGTWANPITVAVGHSIIRGRDVLDWPAGTRWYVPALKRYFVTEDSCGDGPRPQNGPCHRGYPQGASTWLDIWVGGRSLGRAASDRCMDRITKIYTVIRNPQRGLPVTPGEICH